MDPAGRPGQVGTPARRVSHTLAHSGGWAVRTLPGAFLAGDGPSTRGDAGDTGWGGRGRGRQSEQRWELATVCRHDMGAIAN